MARGTWEEPQPWESKVGGTCGKGIAAEEEGTDFASHPPRGTQWSQTQGFFWRRAMPKAPPPVCKCPWLLRQSGAADLPCMSWSPG